MNGLNSHGTKIYELQPGSMKRARVSNWN